MTNSRHITESGHWARTSSHIQRRMKRCKHLNALIDGNSLLEAPPEPLL